jgi:tripartite-type tricarboxylate transporter receptor subunit TctC
LQDASAQAYPSRPIKLMVHLEPGGGLDFVARVFGQRMSEGFNQPVIVENRPGAQGVIASELVARSAPDGYTLMLGNKGSHGVNQAVIPKLPFDTVRDFSCISLIGAAPLMAVVPSSLGITTVKGFVDRAKEKPGAMNFASAGSLVQLFAELFKHKTAIDIVHVPYKGSAPALTALLRGEAHLYFSSTTSVSSHLAAGKLKALGIVAQKRSPRFPDIPTMAEQGLPGFEFGTWYGLIGPSKMPASTVSRLNQEVIKIAEIEDYRQKVAAQGADVVTSTPEYCGQLIAKEVETWTELIKAANLKID